MEQPLPEVRTIFWGFSLGEVDGPLDGRGPERRPRAITGTCSSGAGFVPSRVGLFEPYYSTILLKRSKANTTPQCLRLQASLSPCPSTRTILPGCPGWTTLALLSGISRQDTQTGWSRYRTSGVIFTPARHDEDQGSARAEAHSGRSEAAGGGVSCHCVSED